MVDTFVVVVGGVVLCYTLNMDDSSIILNPDENELARGGKRRRGLVGLVMKLSGGRIQTETNANYALLVFAVIVFIISLIILFAGR